MTAGGAGAPKGPVLVVEDEAPLRQMIRWTLEAEGYAVETASDGQEAVERAAGPRPALVLLDMMLPVVDGVGVADALRAAYPEPPPILVITADARAAEKAQRVGAYAHLAKPFDLEDLIALVRQGLSAPAGRDRTPDLS